MTHAATKRKLGRNMQQNMEHDEFLTNTKVWDRLFTLATERTKAKEEYIEKCRKEKEERELEKYTFKPEISENSRKLALDRSVKVEDRYKTYSKDSKIKEINILKQRAFSPNNSKPKKEYKWVSDEIFNTLYNDVQVRKLKQEKLSKKL